MKFENILLLVLVVVLSFMLHNRGYLPALDPLLGSAQAGRHIAKQSVTPTPAPVSVVEATATPEPTPEATPKPTPVSEATPAPEATPVALATPISTPEPPIALNELSHRYLPQQVSLTRPTEFAIVANGKQIGSAIAPTGMQLKLIAVHGDQLEVQKNGTTKLIPAADTDIQKRVKVLMRTVSERDTSAPAATPLATPFIPTLN
ncbi:MAG: hypothetical protein WCP06_13390 [Verrucomicrobiota bacterium]